MLENEYYVVSQEGHGVFVAAGDHEDCFVRVEHREPNREGPRDFGDARLATFSENVEAVLTEAFEGRPLVGEGVEREDASRRMFEFTKISQEPGH